MVLIFPVLVAESVTELEEPAQVPDEKEPTFAVKFPVAEPVKEMDLMLLPLATENAKAPPSLYTRKSRVPFEFQTRVLVDP